MRKQRFLPYAADPSMHASWFILVFSILTNPDK